ncbi:MAG: hypothetical protein AAFV93_09590 [Chloroflexota bacterium]
MKTPTFIESKLERALDAVCQIEDVTRYEHRKASNEHNVLHFEIVLELQAQDPISILLPVLSVATESSQWITIQILNICGWRKEAAEVS